MPAADADTPTTPAVRTALAQHPAGRIAAVRVGAVRTVRWRDADVPTGAFKEPVEGPVKLGVTGLAGDGQGDTVHHGGPEKAVMCYARSHYAAWRADGLDLPEGALFENLTVDGLTEAEVCLADVWQVGDAVLQVSQSRRPCWKLSSRWGVPDLARRVQATGRTGWYLRVLTPAPLAAGQRMRLVDRAPGAVDLAALSRVMTVDKDDLRAAERVLASPGVPDSWRSALQRRLELRRAGRIDAGPDEEAPDEDADRLGP
ncbi:MOSC domain-containing protein [Citricoccus nitrophenolicus]|uniref:MOSC domain-containing protein n=1 Tax=Citricoccus nitrophenolicus TaxID=863575 RepID=A0ABV0ILS6_9MICC|nr:MOSC domain-containing protein [Citricoccus sp. I39-566]WMY79600.1 MOSC domain-containing protein [Citricoccus sp. I39-566]